MSTIEAANVVVVPENDVEVKPVEAASKKAADPSPNDDTNAE